MPDGAPARTRRKPLASDPSSASTRGSTHSRSTAVPWFRAQSAMAPRPCARPVAPRTIREAGTDIRTHAPSTKLTVDGTWYARRKRRSRGRCVSPPDSLDALDSTGSLVPVPPEPASRPRACRPPYQELHNRWQLGRWETPSTVRAEPVLTAGNPSANRRASLVTGGPVATRTASGSGGRWCLALPAAHLARPRP